MALIDVLVWLFIVLDWPAVPDSWNQPGFRPYVASIVRVDHSLGLVGGVEPFGSFGSEIRWARRTYKELRSCPGLGCIAPFPDPCTCYKQRLFWGRRTAFLQSQINLFPHRQEQLCPHLLESKWQERYWELAGLAVDDLSWVSVRRRALRDLAWHLEID